MRTAAIAWLFFLITGLWISLVVPLGEGFDEPWHFGYIQYVAQTHRLPPGPHLHLSVELESFLERHPMGWRIHDLFPNFRTQEQYWQQSVSDRQSDDTAIRDLHFSGSYVEASSRFTEQYESHQAPLYYVLSAPLFVLSSRFLSLADTFLLLRIWSVVLASAVVPLSYILAKRMSASHVVPRTVAVLVAIFPGMYPDIARVSNDALLVPLAAAALVAVILFVDSRSNGHALLVAMILVAGLCTKALFVPIVIAVLATLLAVREYRVVGWIVLASAAGSIWYVRNAWITGSATGLPETVSAQSSIVSSMRSVGTIHWLGVLKLAAVSHIWMGNWSLLQYRSWIYETVIVFFGIGVFGFLLYMIRSHSGTIVCLCVVYATYCLALVYYATQVVQKTGTPVIQGWYLSPVVPIEAIIFALGTELLFRKWSKWAAIFVATCFMALLIYGNGFIAAPYYTGFIDHAPSGHLRAYHPHLSDVLVMASRLTRFHPFIPAWTPLLLGVAVVITGIFLTWNLHKSSHA